MKRALRLSLLGLPILLAAAFAIPATLASAAAGVTATFTQTSTWGTGYEGKYVITNGGTTTITSWTVEFDLATGQRVSSLWDGTLTTSGQHVTVRNVSWNGTLNPGASASFGFIVAHSGNNAAPTNCRVNGGACDGSGGPTNPPTTGPTTGPPPTDTQPPTVPGNLRVTGTSATSVSLAWNASTDNVGVTGYDVFRNGVQVTTVSGTAYTDTGLSPSTTYQYRVRARDAAGNTSAQTAQVPGTTQPGGGGGARKRIAYFTQWGVYARNYQVKNIDTSGSAARLTHIHYAFGNVSQDGRCFEANQLGVGDAWADYQRRLGAGESVNGQADTFNQPLAGNFNQLKQLKAKHPHLKVIFSLGGWTWSRYFSNAALTAASRQAFVASCIDLFIKGNLPMIGGEPQGGAGSAFGVFDGIDLDWEWPGSEGNAGNVIRPEDKPNFTLLAQEFQRQLDAYGATVGRQYTLSAFLPADPAKINAGFENAAINHLDYATVQGYDLHGSWENQTNHQSQIFSPSADPTPQRWSVDLAVRTWLGKGAPASKLSVGVPAYGRGWQGVPTTNNGLYQASGGPAPGTWEAGNEDYDVLVTRAGSRFRDSQNGAYWLFANGQFWSYDDPELIRSKGGYVVANGLGGLMIWSLDGDNGALVQAMQAGLG